MNMIRKVITKPSHALVAAMGLSTLTPIAPAQVSFDGPRIISTSPSNDDEFGSAVAIDNNIAVIACPGDNGNGAGSGAVYTYNATTGAFRHRLVGTGVGISDRMGTGVAIDNKLILVGTQFGEANFMVPGTAYLFNALTGAQITRFVPSDSRPAGWFGADVAISGPLALVGSPNVDNPDNTRGVVYAYHSEFLSELTQIKPDLNSGDEWFGWSIAVNQSYVVIGAPGRELFPNVADGAVYIYDYASGARLHRLTAPPASPEARFGWDVAIDGNTIVVGAPSDNRNAYQGGAAYVYNAGTGALLSRIVPADTASGDHFGSSVDIDDGIIAVGAEFAYEGSMYDSGSVYAFDASTYAQLDKIIPDLLGPDDNLGTAVAIQSGTIVAGAPSFHANPLSRGEAYILHGHCHADLNNDGATDFLDISRFINTRYDWNGDGFFDFLDISGFIMSYNAGCPLP